MSIPNYHLITVRERAWRFLVHLAGVAQMGVGIAILANGPAGFALGVFDATEVIPWWAWGTAALVGGTLILWPRASLVGLCVAASWWSMWGALLILGVILAGGPFYPIATYGMLIALHVLLGYVEWADRRDGYR